MALPVPKAEPTSVEGPYIFRTTRGADGGVRIRQLPATLENLLDPRLEDQVTRSNRHLKTLVLLFDALKRYLERLAPNLAVYSDLLLLYKRHGYRDVTPDVAVVDGLADRDSVDQSLDVIAEGAKLRLVIEVVSTDTRDMRRKDEEVNPGLFADLGVEDHVLVYPPEDEVPMRIEARRLSSFGGYVDNPPDRRGRVFLESVGLWLWTDEESGRLALEHRESGERLLTSEEEEAESRQAQRHAAETVLKILESRDLSLTEADRRRVLGSRDMEELRRWTDRAFSVQRVEDL
jgi:Uma2 family endonuclease